MSGWPLAATIFVVFYGGMWLWIRWSFKHAPLDPEDEARYHRGSP